MIENKANEVDETAKVNRAQIEHRAMWMGLIFDEMRKEKLDAEGIIRRAICRRGDLDGKRFKEACKKEGNFEEFKNVFLDKCGIDSFHMDPVDATKDGLHISFHYCALVNAWKKLGFDDETCALLCDMAMDGDRHIAKGMGFELDLTDTIAKGCKTCELRFHK